MNMAMTFRFP